MKRGEQYNYEIVKGNGSGVVVSVQVVKGESLASHLAERYNERMPAQERDAGWSCYQRRTTLPVYPKPAKKRALKPDSRGKR